MQSIVIARQPNACDPRLVFQTTGDRSKVPDKVSKAWETYAPEFHRAIFDDQDMRSFLRTYFAPIVLSRFETLPWPHKADLWRYCVLYIYGGTYADIKTELVRNLRDVISGSRMVVVQGIDPGTGFYNGFIHSPIKEHPLFLDLIQHVLKTTDKQIESEYQILCRYLQTALDRVCGGECRLGLNEVRGLPDVYLLKESSMDLELCNGKGDRYGLCTFFTDKQGDIKVKTRYHDYPW